MKIRLLFFWGVLLLITACRGSDTGLDDQLRSLIKAQGLTGDPSIGRILPSIDSPKAQLGMMLFFTKGLGGDMDSACTSCHHPVLGGGDNLSLSIGSEAVTPDLLGPGRLHSPSGTHYDAGPTVPRNAPTTFNIGLWDRALFHDGRVESLQVTAKTNGANNSISTPDSGHGVADPNAGFNLTMAQARFPVTSPEEMRGFSFEAGNSNTALRTHLVNRFNGTAGELTPNDWLIEFQKAFNNPTGTALELITEENIFDAIGEYERSQVFVNTPWKAYVEGNALAISQQAKLGAVLFFSSNENGGANCVACHAGDFFTDEDFHVVAMPQIGRGKGNGTKGNDDFGRFNVTGNPADMYAFRTPSLLNVEMTGPWNHTGSYTSLEAVVRHISNPQQAIENYDFTQINSFINSADMLSNTRLAMAKLEADRAANVDPVLKDLNLSEEQVAQLVAFLKTLTDPCLKDRSCIGKWIPTGASPNPDLLRVNAIGHDGNPL